MVWLDHYGQQLTHLEMSSFPRPLQQLPCPNLLELVLSGSSVQLGPAADGTPGVIQGCTKLTKLELRCNIRDAPRGDVITTTLSRLLQLEHLQVIPLRGVAIGAYSVGGLHSGTLPCLKHLTRLDVYRLAVDNVAQLGALTNLRDFALRINNSTAAPVGPSSVPAFALPVSLTRLELCSAVEAGVLSLVPAGLKDFALVCAVEGAAEAPSLLLSCLARLQHVTRLYLHPEGDLSWPPAGPAYSALTASTNLVELSMGRTYGLPTGMWPHVFPANRCLSQLTRLGLDLPEPAAAEPAEFGAWDAADVSCFVSCCPNVVEIDTLILQREPDLSSRLHDLIALTYCYLLLLLHGSGIA
jgi:hypothetical protein